MRRLLLCLFLALPVWNVAVPAQEYHVGTGKNFTTLQDLVTSVTLGANDVIVLYDNDNSLTGPLISGAGPLTIRSSGGNWTISTDENATVDAVLWIDGGEPSLTLDSVSITGSQSTLAGVLMNNTAAADSGTLSISNGVISDNGGLAGIAQLGVFTTTLTDTVISEDLFSIVANDTTNSSALNINFTKNAAARNKWEGYALLEGVKEVNVDVASGIKFEMADLYTQSAGGTGVLNKTGEGTLKLNGGTGERVNITEGVLEFSDGSWAGDSLHVGRNGTLKVTINPGNLADQLSGSSSTSTTTWSYITLSDSITTEKGARTQIGGISLFPTLPHVDGDTLASFGYSVIEVPEGTTLTNSSMVSSMNINNSLLTATWKSADFSQATLEAAISADSSTHDGFLLHIEKLNNLSTLDGIGKWADEYRMMDLSETERDMLDYIYSSGGGKFALGHLQTLGGSIVQNSMLALRHNQANLVNRVNRRLTSYQKEELMPEITGSEVCYYQEYDPVNKYGEIWAAIDTIWMTQDDMDNVAGYTFNSHGGTIGYDWHHDQIIYGGALNYEFGSMKLKNRKSTKTDVQNLLAAAYVSWASEGWYVSATGMAGYGWNDSRSSYTLPGLVSATANTGTYNTSTLGLNAEFGYMMETEFYGMPMRITPYGSLTYSHIARNSVSERGGDSADLNYNREFNSAKWNVWDMALGVRLAAPIQRYDYFIVPSVDVAWTRTGGEVNKGSGAFFTRDPSAEWDIPLMQGNRSSLRAQAGVDMKFQNSLTVGASYEMEWRKQYWRNQLNLTASIEF